MGNSKGKKVHATKKSLVTILWEGFCFKMKWQRSYSIVVGFKVNIQKSVSFLCTSNEQVEFGIKNIVLFILPPPELKYLSINITIYIQNQHEENYKTLMSKVKEVIINKIFCICG